MILFPAASTVSITSNINRICSLGLNFLALLTMRTVSNDWAQTYTLAGSKNNRRIIFFMMYSLTDKSYIFPARRRASSMVAFEFVIKLIFCIEAFCSTDAWVSFKGLKGQVNNDMPGIATVSVYVPSYAQY